MNLGAMIALGVDPVTLEDELRKLPYDGWSLHFETDKRQGITGTRCDVAHAHKYDHHGSHTHAHEHHHHRTFREIREAISQSTLSSKVKASAVACFRALADAEGAVHGIPPEDVHFHEVGAIDSIIDMVGAAICWDLLGIERIVCTTLEVGGGTVKCAHGLMPVPAPATARLLQGTPYSSGATDKETTTPTGAALLIGGKCEFSAKVAGTQLKTAIGIGQRDDPLLANAVYVSLFDEDAQLTLYDRDQVYELAANIDDMTAEAISYLCQQLLTTGALDVWQTPAIFKKDRLGAVIHTLVSESRLQTVEDTFFKHSRTLGIRRQLWQRSKLPREIISKKTPWGLVRAKKAISPDGSIRQKFEYDDCIRIAQSENQSIEWVERQLETYFK